MVGPEKFNHLPEVHYQSLSEVERRYWWHISRLNWAEKFIRNICTDAGTLNILDYGCGTGGFLYSLNRRLNFKSCLGVDSSDKAIEFARKYGSYYKQVKLPDFRLPDDVNLILLMDVLEHCEDDELFLRFLTEDIKRKIYILVSVPALPMLYSNWDNNLGHYRRYTKESLARLINKSGANIIKMEYCFSYLVPAVFLNRVLLKTFFGEQNCAFPPVPKFLNEFLLKLNRLEMSLSKYLSIPFGTSIFCLFQR